jgi:PAS domain S-box-containing protein
MKRPEPTPDPDLRKQAENRANEHGQAEAPAGPGAAEAYRHLVEELRIHQVELEMQNEELHRAQDQITRAHARYFALYDQAPVGYCTLSAEGTILEANLTAAQLLGAPEGSLPGRPFTDFVSAADQDAHYLQFRQSVQDGTAHAWDLRLCRADGSAFWARLSLAGHGGPLPGGAPDSGAPPQSWVSLTDLTETKRAEAERVDSLALLSAGIAHDFNNLLGAMLGNLELYRLDHGAGDPGMERLEVVEAQIFRASLIVGQLLAYSGKGSAPLGAVELNQEADEALRLLGVTLAPYGSLRRQPAPGRLFMEGESAQIQQVIMNLLLNAAEAVVPGHGEIALRTGAALLGGGDLPPGLGPGPHVWVEVADNGTGIPEPVRGRIFDPFFTTKATGRGLGLSAVRGIVERHRGAIQIISQEGRGTQFRLVFPAIPSGTVLPAGEPTGAPSGEAPALGEATILVVDDDDALRTVALAGLRHAGYATLEARDGGEALAILDRDRDRVALVLLDQCMPGMTGVETAQRMRQAGLRMPIILSSGFNRETVFKDHPADAFAEFLPKPYRHQALLDAVRRALGAGAPARRPRA